MYSLGAQVEPRDERADTVDEAASRVLGTVAAYTKLVANEPSVGLYFVQEHVRKSVPFVMATKARVLETGKQAQLCRLDVDAGLATMKLMREVGSPTLRRMNASLTSASQSLARLKNARGGLS